MSDLATLVPLLAETGDLKRVRTAGNPRSLAERSFLRAWAALASGADPEALARAETAAAVAGAKLAGIDAAVLAHAGLAPDEVGEVLQQAYGAATGGVVPDPLDDELRRSLSRSPMINAGQPPSFAFALCEQPRAGATRPGHPRLVLEPPESHGDHCWAVAVYGALCSPRYGADPTMPFVCGLAHHLHNAVWPDAGYAGDELLGDRVAGIIADLAAEALSTLPTAVRPLVEKARELIYAQDSPEARAFQAADVIDRVLQQRQYARVAAFTLDHALEELDLVHPGPLQRFHLELLSEAGLT